jgi:hypothetical protein
MLLLLLKRDILGNSEYLLQPQFLILDGEVICVCDWGEKNYVALLKSHC